MARAAQIPADSVLLDREVEIATIGRAVEDTERGGGRLLVIEGRAGIGKTRLLTRARAVAEDTGFRVLAARAGELEQEFAFGVVRQLFEPLLAALPDLEREELLGGAASLSRPLFEESDRMSDAQTATDPSFAMMHGLYWLAANLAARHPTMLAVDDLHWGDRSSLQWIAYLARRLEGVPLLLAVATRAPEQSAEPALVTEVVSDPAAVVVRPGPLGHAAVGALLRQVFSDEPHPEFVAACGTATGGNPLFLRALLGTLEREGLDPRDASGSRALDTGPEEVSRLVALRLARLPREASALLVAAAVFGDGATLRQIGALADLSTDAAARAVTTLLRSDLLSRDDPVEFVHPIIRTATYREIGLDERARAHRRAAELLVDAGAPLEQAAAHLVRTHPNGDAFVSAVLRGAADRAVARGAPQAAISYLRRALDEPPAWDERGQVLTALGLAELHIDAFAAVEHLRAAFDVTEGPRPRAESALLYARALLWLDRFDAAVGVLQETLDDIDEREVELRELLEAVLIGCTLWTPELKEIGRERMARVREETLGSGLGGAVMRAHLGYHVAREGRSREQAVALASQALDGGLLYGSETVWGLAAMVTLAIAGEVDAAAIAYNTAVENARRRGDLLDLVPLLLLRGWLAYERGDLLAAEEDLLSPELGLAEAASTTAANGAGLRAELLLERGRLDDTIQMLDGLRGNEPTHSEYRHWYLYARGRMEVQMSRVEEGVTSLRLAGAEMNAVGAHNPALARWRSEAALALRRLGRIEEAEQLAREELDLATQWGAPRAIGVALRAVGLVKGGSEGQLLLREAVDVLGKSPAQLEHARALIALGGALRRANRRTEAREFLVRGVDLAHRAGASPLVREGQDELAAMGARSRKIVVTGVDALTASERRVARMAADGLSNREIAQSLFVTVKAVEVHLTSAYRKLSINSRRQLPEVLGENARRAAAATLP